MSNAPMFPPGFGRILLSHNEAAGIKTWIVEDPDDPDGAFIQTEQDVSTLLDENQVQRNLAQDHWKGDWHSVARVPASLAYGEGEYIHDALKEQDTPAVKKFLSDRDFSKLRTKTGNL